MKLWKLSLPLAGLFLICTTAARAETCGQIMASKAVLPEQMSKVMTAVANMADAHAAFMTSTNKTPESKKEAAALQKVAKEHRGLAASFTKTAATMKKMADLPGAEHDMAKMSTDPKMSAAMQEMLTTHKDMLALLQKEVAEMEAMMGPGKAGAGPAPAKK